MPCTEYCTIQAKYDIVLRCFLFERTVFDALSNPEGGRVEVEFQTESSLVEILYINIGMDRMVPVQYQGGTFSMVFQLGFAGYSSGTPPNVPLQL